MFPNSNNMHQKNVLKRGNPDAKKVLIMIHGRGGSAEDILSFANHLNVNDYQLIAPQATNQTWYPFSFMASPAQNEPWLSSAISLIGEIVKDVQTEGITPDKIYFLGFSQGACLTLEYVTRHAQRYGGVIALTGGLIGDKIYPENYSGDFGNTPVFIGSSDPDPHVPVQRVYATVNILKNMNAQVEEKIYPGMGHTINEDEIEHANKILNG